MLNYLKYNWFKQPARLWSSVCIRSVLRSSLSVSCWLSCTARRRIIHAVIQAAQNFRRGNPMKIPLFVRWSRNHNLKFLNLYLVFFHIQSRRQLQELESLKPRYLKGVLGVSKSALSRYVYVLTRETFLIKDLRTQMLLQHTPAYEELLREL